MSTQRTPRRFRPELLIEVPAVIVTLVMMVHITANALLRTFAHDPIQHTLEIVQYWYVPTVAFLGFVAAQHRGQHIAADLVFELLPKVTRRFVLCAVFVICAVLCLGFARYGWNEATHALDIRKTAGVSDVPSWPSYFLVPFAFAILTVQFAIASVRAITRPEIGHVVTDIEDSTVMDQVAIDAVQHSPAADLRDK
jgi:TRAP-type C4-dicarboxylate transport system permease small subunit